MSLARDLALALDPARFMREAGYPPDPWQRELLTSAAPRTLVLCCRQSGKSTVVAALACHTALYRPGALVLIFSPSQQQSLETFRKVVQFLRVTAATDPEAESALRVELANGSRIVALSGNDTTARGFSGPRLVLIDEAAFTSEELYDAVTPMLAAGGRLVATSTPNGRRGWFYRAWESEGLIWRRFRITAHDTSRITPEFLDIERATKPAWRFNAEYMCEFTETANQLFASDLLSAAAMVPETGPLIREFQW